MLYTIVHADPHAVYTAIEAQYSPVCAVCILESQLIREHGHS